MKTSQTWVEDIERKLTERYQQQYKTRCTVLKVVPTAIGCAIIMCALCFVPKSSSMLSVNESNNSDTMNDENNHTDPSERGDDLMSQNPQIDSSGKENAVSSHVDSSNILLPNNNAVSDVISGQIANDDQPDNGTAVFTVFVWKGNIYKINDDVVLSSNLDKLISLDSNSRIHSFYSIKKINDFNKVAYKANGKVFCYDCVYNEKITLSGIEYEIVDTDIQDPDAQKGELIGTYNGVVLYKSTHNPDAIVVDVKNILHWDNEVLYVALKS